MAATILITACLLCQGSGPPSDAAARVPPTFFRDRGKEYDTNAILRKETIPQIRAVARQANVPVIDLCPELQDNSACFADGVHPNERGAEIIAAQIARSVRGERFGPQSLERP